METCKYRRKDFIYSVHSIRLFLVILTLFGALLAPAKAAILGQIKNTIQTVGAETPL